MNKHSQNKVLATLILVIVLLCALIVAASCKKDAEQLSAPTIGIDEGNNVFWNTVDNATGYVVYVNGQEQSVQQETRFNALTADGEYTIEVVAKGDGITYLDSGRSSSVKYSVKSSSILSSLPESFDFFTRRKISGDMIVISGVGLSADQTIFAQTLQGLGAKKGMCFYIDNGNGGIDLKKVGHPLRYMSLNEAVLFAWQSNMFKGYVKANSQSFDLAKTACSIYEGIVATDSTLDLLPNNCKMVFDATTKKFEDIPAEKTQFLSSKVVVNSAYFVDLGVMNNARFTSDDDVIANYRDGIVLGEGKSLCNIDFTQKDNLSALSMLEVDYLRNDVNGEIIDNNKHLVTLIGASNYLIDYVASNYTYPVLQSSLAPLLLKTSQSRGKTSDLYIAADVCSNTNWQYLSNQQKNDYSSMINICMGNAGMRYITISNKDLSALDRLSYMSNINGGFIYSTNQTVWKNGKPFCGFSATLTNENAEELATKISAMSTDIRNLQAYTAINVAASTTVDTIKAFYGYLDKTVQVVRADKFIETMRVNAFNQGGEVILPQQTDASYITVNHDDYDVFAFKFMPASDSLYYLFTNSLADFCKNADGRATIDINENHCEFVRDDNEGKSYIYSKIRIPSWDNAYLNLQVATSGIAKARVLLYSVADNKFETLYDNTVATRGFEDLSFDLTALSFSTAGKEVVIIVEQDKLSVGKEILKLDNINISKTKKRAEIYDKESVDASSGANLTLTADSIVSNGDVVFDGGVILSTDKKSFFDEALSSIGSKVKLSSLSNQSYLLSINVSAARNALIRIRLVDKSFISNIVQQWKLINGNVQLDYDISSYAGQDVVLFVELCNTEYDEAKFTVNSIKFNKNTGKYYYGVGVKDSFEGTQEHWNLNGWTVNNNVSFGDLTQESGYGSLRFDGSNNGVFDPNLAIGRATKNYSLSQSACQLSFWARSGGPTNATYLRVVVITDDGNETILRTDKSTAEGWTLISGEPWINVTYDLSAYKGRNITVAIEQTDHGVGVGEIVFVDSVIIEEM